MLPCLLYLQKLLTSDGELISLIRQTRHNEDPRLHMESQTLVYSTVICTNADYNSADPDKRAYSVAHLNTAVQRQFKIIEAILQTC